MSVTGCCLVDAVKTVLIPTGLGAVVYSSGCRGAQPGNFTMANQTSNSAHICDHII